MNFDIQGQTVTIQVSLLDAGGAVLKVYTFSDTLAALGITPAQVAAIKTRVVEWLQQKGAVN